MDQWKVSSKLLFAGDGLVDNKTGDHTKTPRYQVTLRLQQESIRKETTLSRYTKVSVGSFVMLLTDTDNRNLSNVCLGQ